MKNKVLDKGFIEVIDSLGDDLTVVNSARVSVLLKTTLGMRLVVGMYLYPIIMNHRFGENNPMIINKHLKESLMTYNRKE